MQKSALKISLLCIILEISSIYLAKHACAETSYFIYNAPGKSVTAIANHSQNVLYNNQRIAQQYDSI